MTCGSLPVVSWRGISQGAMPLTPVWREHHSRRSERRLSSGGESNAWLVTVKGLIRCPSRVTASAEDGTSACAHDGIPDRTRPLWTNERTKKKPALGGLFQEVANEHSGG